MTDNRTTELLRLLEERGVVYKTHDIIGGKAVTWHGSVCNWVALPDENGLAVAVYKDYLTPEQAIAATLRDEAPKKCSTCQYRYVVGQRPYPTFGYMCGFGDGKKLCGRDTGVLDHMCCEHWEKELR